MCSPPRRRSACCETGLKSLDDQKQATEALAKRGAASRIEVNNVEIQRDSTDLTLLEAQETYDDAKRTLAALLCLPLEEAETFKIRGSLRGSDLPAPPVETLIRKGLEIRPDLAAFRLGVLRARSEVRLAQANRFDDVFLLYQPFSSPTGPQARRALRDLLGDRADGPPAGLQPQPGEHRQGHPDRRPDGGPARQPGAAGHPRDPAGRSRV